MLAAACVVLGYLFMPVPNVEMITAAIFLSGLWTGPRHGLIIGLTAEALFSLSNPMGFPPPPLLAAQLAGMGLAGWTGGMLRGLVARVLPLRLLLAQRAAAAPIPGPGGVNLPENHEMLH